MPQVAAPAQVPEQPPPGWYDPGLDAQAAAANRGVLDLGQDVQTGNLRDTVDYGLGRDSILRGQTRGLEDLGSQRSQLDTGYGRNVADVNQGFDRGSQDLGTARTRAEQDYQRNVGELTRRYGQLGTSQRQQQGRAGVMRGGAMLQAAAKRDANQAYDQQPLDTGYQRFGQDNAQSLSRLTENRDTSLGRLGQDHQTGIGMLDRATGRLNEDTSLGLGDLALKMAPPDASNPFGGRSFQDRTTTLTRGQRENQFFGQDVGAARFYQAAGAGWTPPPDPRRRGLGG